MESNHLGTSLLAGYSRTPYRSGKLPKLAEDEGIEPSAIPGCHGFQDRFAPCAASSNAKSPTSSLIAGPSDNTVGGYLRQAQVLCFHILLSQTNITLIFP